MKDLNEETTPRTLLAAGAEILGAVLCPHGFVFAWEGEGKGSGGYFACGGFTRNDRRLELHFRYSLGMVTYHVGAASLRHEDYMRLQGVFGRNLYPDFPQEPLDSFRSLAADLRNFGADFLSGDAAQFMALAQRFARNPGMFKGIP